MVEVEEMTRRECVERRGWELPENELHLENEKVFKVVCSNGQTNMFPKEAFLESAIKVGENDFVSEEVVNEWLKNCEVETKELFGKPYTFVHCQLPNKFVISESTSCVDPKNYSEEIGAEICKSKLKDKIWYILGAHLSSAKYGVRN